MTRPASRPLFALRAPWSRKLLSCGRPGARDAGSGTPPGAGLLRARQGVGGANGRGLRRGSRGGRVEEEEGAGRKVAAPPPAKLEEEEGAGREALQGACAGESARCFPEPAARSGEMPWRAARPSHSPSPTTAAAARAAAATPWRARRAGQLYEAALSEKFDKPPLHAPRYPHA